MITPDELKRIMNMTLDSSFKGGLMITLSQVLYKNQVNFKNFLYIMCKVPLRFPVTTCAHIFFHRNITQFFQSLSIFPRTHIMLVASTGS